VLVIKRWCKYYCIWMDRRPSVSNLIYWPVLYAICCIYVHMLHDMCLRVVRYTWSVNLNLSLQIIEHIKKTKKTPRHMKLKMEVLVLNSHTFSKRHNIIPSCLYLYQTSPTQCVCCIRTKMNIPVNNNVFNLVQMLYCWYNVVKWGIFPKRVFPKISFTWSQNIHPNPNWPIGSLTINN
jgi:hypothetical protein